jgi:hypothetical protein
MPATMPTVAENPSPRANAHKGSETGKPVARFTATPMPAPRMMPRMPPTDVSAGGFSQELQQNLAATGAERLPHADLTRSFGHRDHHDGHDADPADHQRNR